MTKQDQFTNKEERARISCKSEKNKIDSYLIECRCNCGKKAEIWFDGDFVLFDGTVSMRIEQLEGIINEERERQKKL